MFIPASQSWGRQVPYVMGEGKCEICPITGHAGPKKALRYSSTHSLTSALFVGEWLTPRLGRSNPGGAGWAPGPVWTATDLASPGFDPPTVQSVASR
jgi:hypothetical protein